MDGFVLPKAIIYTGALIPRAVQKIRQQGFLFAVTPASDREPGFCVLRDIDGTKLVVCFTAAIDGRPAEAYFEPIAEKLTDLPVIDLKGKPDDTALTYPKNGLLQGLATMAVNAGNIGLREMRSENGGFILELWETAGKETDYELYCETFDFGFLALFAPWEIRRFFVNDEGYVSEPLAK